MLGKWISGIRISKILLGEDPDPPHGLCNFGACRVGLHTTWSAPPKPNILATPLPVVSCAVLNACLVQVSIFLRDKVQHTASGRFVLPISGALPVDVELPGKIRSALLRVVFKGGGVLAGSNPPPPKKYLEFFSLDKSTEHSHLTQVFP